MLPSLIAREIKSELENFLTSSFPMSTAGFQGLGDKGLMEQFLHSPEQPDSLLKGPWLEIKLPFRSASASTESPLSHVQLGFTPYMHQQRSFERLAGVPALSTLVATGTGSGKTECFLYPILNYCLQERRPGIKAIIVYPMNALATDQARRFAKEVAGLTPQLTIGMFTGDGGSDSRVMSADQVITNQDTIRDNPPDILLTNYKMLDFMLMRPKDQRLWKHNLTTKDLLRYLVVDELHTFDGAQGTDLACLIRRLRDKLQLQDNLACVGTSATIGGESARKQLADYASQVFATDFTIESIVLEDRMSVEEYLEHFQTSSLTRSADTPELRSDWPQVYLQELLPGALQQGTYLRRQAKLWFNSDLALDSKNATEYNAACVSVGDYLHQHTAFLSLLRAASELVDVRQLAEQWQKDFNLADAEYALALLDSLTALVSVARIWANESKQKVRPFLQVRVQLWLRELRRMLASVNTHPRLVHADDLIDPTQPLHLPVMHCRECHSAAWGAMRPQGDRLINPDLSRFYAGWFSQSPDSVLLYPLVEGEVPVEYSRSDEVKSLCVGCYELKPSDQTHCQECDTPTLKVWLPYLVKQVVRKEQPRNVRSDDCPRCSASNSMMILGSRAASLASVAIGQIYGSHCNDDHKLIAFSDSVQDAAHRAGFFGARTYTQTVRQALAQVVRNEGDNMALSRFIDEVPRYWQRLLGSDASFVGTFIAPNMQWLSDYQQLLASQGKEVTKNLVSQVSQRLRWEALTEMGLRSRVGRTLERSEVAVIQPDSNALTDCVQKLLKSWQEELGQFSTLRPTQVEVYLLGFLHRLRQGGAFYDQVLDGYVRERGETFLLKRITWLPGYGFSARPPAALTLSPVSSNFQNLLGSGSQWFKNWFDKTLAAGDDVFVTAEYEQAMSILIRELKKGQWLKEVSAGQDNAWLLRTERWQVVTTVASVACDKCSNRQTVAATQQANWLKMPCLQASCMGSYAPVNSSQQGQLAYRAMPKRLVTSEHTGLLDGKDRLAIEQSFIYGDKAWDVNLLSATPTLEMGIDIGDLSAVLLCSVPPAQANYLQRIGRAGRSTGNALALTIANGSNHDNYFYNEPLEMLAGDVSTPGIYLNAMAVLERQLIAYCFDRWVSTGVSENAIPPKLGNVLNSFQYASKNSLEESFPSNLLDFIDENQEQLLSRFVQMFSELDNEGRSHLRNFIGLQAESIEGIEDAGAAWNISIPNDLAPFREHTQLSWRITNRLQELLQSRESHRSRTVELKKSYDTVKKQPEDPARDQLLGDLKEERYALLALISSINKQPTLNFFTDEGLLPNYAFPEEGVTLNSVIVRKKEKQQLDLLDAEDKTAYERITLKFQRPAQAALNELVPDSVFYVSEHKINIEQIDLRLSTPSEWRMCPSCHYSEDVTVSGDKHSACPRCGDPYWADTQQKQSMLKLRQVYARANARYDRIGDDSDQREPKFFRRQLLIDIDSKDCSKAMRIDNPEVPFGFEFVKSATFREINFGEQLGEHNSFVVAGEKSSRNGFQICRHCGMVRRDKPKKGQFLHALDCKITREGREETEEDWFESLYLFRELKSEAVRILLPLADVAESEVARRSLTAAINLGLKEYFRGAVQHLEVTEMLEPSSTGNKQYLVIYDRIPGGTGYLKQLMYNSSALFSMLEQAQHKLSTCSCISDESKDGCYSCILAYRNSRHRQDISRHAAVTVLSKILHNQDKLVSVDRLSEVPTNHILESVLEERFVQALGKKFKVTKQRINNKPGYWVHADKVMWELEPQVEFGADEGVLKTRADFVLRPLKQADRAKDKELVIYTDGFEHHGHNLTDDIRKRLSLLNSGRKVWVLTWDDLDSENVVRTKSAPELLLSAMQSGAQTKKLWNELAGQHDWHTESEVRGLLEQSSFAWLCAWMTQHTETLKELTDSALCLSVLQLQRNAQLEQFVAQSIKRTGEWREPLLTALAGQSQSWQAITDNDDSEQAAWQLLSYILPEDKGSLATLNPNTHVLLSLNDRLAPQPTSSTYVAKHLSEQNKSYKEKWRAMWQAFNVLQYAPHFSIATQTGLQAGEFSDLLIGASHSSASESFNVLDDPAWRDVYELSDWTAEQIQVLLDITQVAPGVGVDLLDAKGETVGNVEFAWQDLSIALCIEETDQFPKLSGWQFISLLSENWVEQLKVALGKE